MTLRGILIALAAALLGLTGCGGDEDDGGSASTAEALAACAEQAGFEPTISEIEEAGATAVDLTTESATIVLHVFDTEGEAAGYENSAGLDQERVGSVVILGGAIPEAERGEIVDCIRKEA